MHIMALQQRSFFVLEYIYKTKQNEMRWNEISHVKLAQLKYTYVTIVDRGWLIPTYLN